MAYVRGTAHPYNMGLGAIPGPLAFGTAEKIAAAAQPMPAWLIPLALFALSTFVMPKLMKRGRR